MHEINNIKLGDELNEKRMFLTNFFFSFTDTNVLFNRTHVIVYKCFVQKGK